MLCSHIHSFKLQSNKYTIIIISSSSSIQPLGQSWQEPEPSQATAMALARCILGKFLGVVCHCFPLYTYTIYFKKVFVSF
jgi:hypothetical protein